MMTVDDKMQILGLDNDQFAEGLGRLVKAFIDNKTGETTLFTGEKTIMENNYLTLEDNTPILGG